MAILCTTCGTELDLPPGPPPRQVRCPLCRAVMDTDLARHIDPAPYPAPEPTYLTDRPAAPVSSALPVVLILFVVGAAVTVCTGVLFLFFVAMAAEDRARPAAVPIRPPGGRPVQQGEPAFNMAPNANPIPMPGPPPVVVVPGPPAVVPPRVVVPPRPPQFQTPRPVVPPLPRPAVPQR